MSYLKYLYKNESLKLVIQEDSVGFYLIVYNNPISEESIEDYLVDTLEEAFQEAKERFGVLINQWELQNS